MTQEQRELIQAEAEKRYKKGGWPTKLDNDLQDVYVEGDREAFVAGATFALSMGKEVKGVDWDDFRREAFKLLGNAGQANSMKVFVRNYMNQYAQTGGAAEDREPHGLNEGDLFKAYCDHEGCKEYVILEMISPSVGGCYCHELNRSVDLRNEVYTCPEHQKHHLPAAGRE